MHQTFPGTRSVIYNGKKTISANGTQEIIAAAQSVTQITIRALAGNTNPVFIGDADVSSTTGLALAAGETVTFPVGNLADVWVDVTTNGEGVTFLAS